MPIAFDGSNDDSNLKWLCPTCHNLLHRAAENLARGRASQAVALIDAAFPGRADVRSRLTTWAAIAAKAELQARTDAVKSPYITITFTVSREDGEALRSIARESGRKLRPYVKQLLELHIEQHRSPRSDQHDRQRR